MKRALALIMSLLMALGCVFFVVGCGNGDTSVDTGASTLDSSTQDTEILPDVPELDFDGETFLVYMGGQGIGESDKFNDWGEDNDDYTTVATAIFKRNKTLESKFNIVVESEEDWATENGSGKSTLLRHITGVYRESSGTVTVDGQRVWENPQVKSRIASIPDDWHYFMQASIREMRDFYRGFYPLFNLERYEKLGQVFADGGKLLLLLFKPTL